MKICYHLVLLVVLCQLACTTTPDPIQPTPPVQETKETFVLMSIRFTALQGAKPEEITEPRPRLTFSNGTSVRQQVIILPDNVLERSTFRRDTGQTYLVTATDQLYRLPVDVQQEQIAFGEAKWPYAEKESSSTATVSLRDSIPVEPGKKLIGNLTITYRQIQTAYSAQLRGAITGKLVNLTGIWTGRYPVRKNFTYDVTSL